MDDGTRFYFAIDDTLADAILNIGLDGTFQRTGTKLYVVALGGHKFLGFVAEFNGIAHIADTFEESFQFDVDDEFDGLEVELVESDDFVQSV